MERLQDARTAGRPKDELLVFLNDAARRFHEALELLPEDDVDDLAGIHYQLGRLYHEAGALTLALPHYQKAIRYREAQGKLFKAAHARFYAAWSLASMGRFADALAYAEEALRGYEGYRERAAEEVASTRGLIEEIQRVAQARL